MFLGAASDGVFLGDYVSSISTAASMSQLVWWTPTLARFKLAAPAQVQHPN